MTTRRVPALLAAGARVTVVSPALTEALTALAADGTLAWVQRAYAAGDLAGAWLVHTATGVADVDATVAADAEAARIWCTRADDAEASSAWTPAVARSGDITVTVSAGRDPRRAVALRTAIAELLDDGTLPVRHRRPALPGTPGRVALVGAGPGDVGLVTVRGRRLLAEADVVVVDRLAPQELLTTLDADVVVIDVGKSPKHHPVPQAEIERLLVEHALAGKRVVRLKGGDPYVFGRGAEELATCRAAGLEVEVVPGVTSAIAGPAAAGIPVTHRDLASSFTVATAHDALAGGTRAALASMVRSGGTLVLLMGVSQLGAVATGLIEHGCDPTIPVAIVERASTPGQRLTVATLASVAEVAGAVGVRAPAVIVIGAVAALAGL